MSKRKDTAAGIQILSHFGLYRLAQAIPVFAARQTQRHSRLNSNIILFRAVSSIPQSTGRKQIIASAPFTTALSPAGSAAARRSRKDPTDIFPPAAFRPSNPCPAPFEPLPHPKRYGRFHKKRHPGITMPLSPGQTAASPRIKRGKPSTPARPFPYGICGTPIFRAPFPIPASAAPPCRRAACP